MFTPLSGSAIRSATTALSLVCDGFESQFPQFRAALSVVLQQPLIFVMVGRIENLEEWEEGVYKTVRPAGALPLGGLSQSINWSRERGEEKQVSEKAD